MTVDNLLKRNISKPLQCQFCTEFESSPHLFFECIVARNAWHYVDVRTDVKIRSYEDMACKWPCGGNYEIVNCISAGVCWGIWLTRNDMVFNRQIWRSIKTVLGAIWRCIITWKPMLKDQVAAGVDLWCSYLEGAITSPLAIKAA
ncbi:hypothetical protein PAHAL_1G115300 [Panicum hallii]|jgi:hypothetical protein|uniref:Reverse transcriptase zinc-binding domain-containing protein n=1 Tax=Panicum hallii TaxID=206008 RepID=A0A2T8KV03_9POAL|nr:hypothetical protein PAHAL_1G115300 [Panicum hallii]